MTVLVTGATGFLGAAVAVHLHALGLHVVATGRDQAKLDRLAAMGLCAFAHDLTQPLTLDQPVKAVVHIAALSAPWGRYESFAATNIQATRNIVDFAIAAEAARFVHISTASVYFRFADQDQLPEETALPSPVNHYVATKLRAEQVVRASGLDHVILRPRGVYGAGDNALLPRLLRVAHTRHVPRFAQMGATDVTHVDDVVTAVAAVLNAGPELTGETLNITGGVAVPLPEIIEKACAAIDVTPRWRKMSFGAALAAIRLVEGIARRMPGQPQPPVTAYDLGVLRYRQSLDISKANKLLGWSPQVSFDEGLRRTFADGAVRGGLV